MADIDDIIQTNETERYLTLEKYVESIKSQYFFTVIHINLRSLKKNFAQLEVALSTCSKDIDIIALTEINVTENEISAFQLDGYDAYHKCRQGRSGGGILILYKKQFVFCNKNVNLKSAEGVLSTFYHGNHKIHLIVLYRPPKIYKKDTTTLFITEINTMLKSFLPKDEVIIVGDMNINLLERENTNVIQYENMFSNYGYDKKIHGITREEFRKDHLCKSCLDHIFVKVSTNTISAVIETKLADHYFICVTIEREKYQQPRQLIKVLNNHKILQELKKVNWKDYLNESCPLVLYNRINKTFNDIYNDNTKEITTNDFSLRRTCPWITKDIQNMISHKDNLFKKWKNNPTNQVYRREYNKWRNKANKEINRAKNNHKKTLILEAGTNIKKIWDYINKWLGKEKKSVDEIIVRHMGKNDEIKTICEKFSNTFSNEIDSIKHKCDKQFLDRNSYTIYQNKSMRFQKVTTASVIKILNNLNVNKSPGIDKIRLCDIKLIKEEVSPIIAHFINLCIHKQLYPDELKVSIIRPLFKGGNHSNPGDYRPIAVLPTLNKIVEKAIVNQVSSYLNINNIITEYQYGFQKGKNTTKLLSKFANEINTSLNSKKQVAVLFIDFKKAFDTLDHSTLLTALDESGIRGSLQGWFANYLKNRTLTVKISDEYSSRKMVKYGVAQGSVSGPVCYIVHVNSMVSIIKKCQKYMFADDTCLMYAGHDPVIIQNNMQSDLNNIMMWAHDNGIILNNQKTKIMNISSSYRKIDIQQIELKGHSYDCLHLDFKNCKCLTIESVIKYKYLGLTVDNRFCWKYQINEVSDKLRVLLSKFKSLSYCTPRSILYMLYHALVDSVLSYGIECFGFTFKTQTNKIKDLQIRFLKVIVGQKTKKQYAENYELLFQKCKVLTARKKCFLLLTLDEFWNDEYKNKIKSNYNTRSKTQRKLVVPKVINLYGRRTKDWLIPKLFNSIPDKIKDIKGTKNMIKNKLKQFFLNDTELSNL